MTVIAVNRDPIALTFTIVAEFDEPAERVWQVWADPRQLERWWGPPNFPATVVDHDLTVGGRVSYYMTGPEGEKLPGWWRISAVDPPYTLEFESGCADDEGRPVTSSTVEVRLVETPGKTTMTVTSRFASIEDMERALATGQDRGIALAVGQIDAILAVPNPGQGRATAIC